MTLQKLDSGIESLLTAPWPELVVDGPSEVRKVNTSSLGIWELQIDSHHSTICTWL